MWAAITSSVRSVQQLFTTSTSQSMPSGTRSLASCARVASSDSARFQVQIPILITIPDLDSKSATKAGTPSASLKRSITDGCLKTESIASHRFGRPKCLLETTFFNEPGA